MMHLDDLHVHHDKHDMLDSPFQHSHTCPVLLEHYHNGNLFRVLHDRVDNRHLVRPGFYEDFVYLFYDADDDELVHQSIPVLRADRENRSAV